MNLSIGIVGLPNVGKSTLFNALLKKQTAFVANYPFATIEPNVGVVPVPDERLLKIAEITKEEEKMSQTPPIKPAVINFVDIAGLVKGASEGAGLGNKFLSHIREVSVIAHVVRAFEDPDILREGSVSPKDDYQTIQTELILADLQTLTKTLENRKLEPLKKEAAEKLSDELNSGKRAHDVNLTEEEKEAIKDLFLLTQKPEIIVLNVSEDQYSEDNIPKVIKTFSESLGISDTKFAVVCAKIESDLASLSEAEQKQYLEEIGIKKSGLERTIEKAYENLGLISFLTCGEKEVRAWTIEKGINAQNAAGVIHTDFIKGFIKAEIVSFSDFVDNNGWKGSREKGKARLEGRDYIIKNGDIVEFKINA